MWQTVHSAPVSGEGVTNGLLRAACLAIHGPSHLHLTTNPGGSCQNASYTLLVSSLAIAQANKGKVQNSSHELTERVTPINSTPR